MAADQTPIPPDDRDEPRVRSATDEDVARLGLVIGVPVRPTSSTPPSDVIQRRQRRQFEREADEEEKG
jgi:hypothetical protein